MDFTNYQRENILRAHWGLIHEGNSLRERVVAGHRYLLRCSYANTKAEPKVNLILEMTNKISNGDSSKITDEEIIVIADEISELAMGLDKFVPASHAVKN